MPGDNLDRMIHLAGEFFEVKSDPDQLAITPEVMERLRRLHPRTLNEAANENGPIACPFYWRFSDEGERLATVVARACHLPLYQRV